MAVSLLVVAVSGHILLWPLPNPTEEGFPLAYKEQRPDAKTPPVMQQRRAASLLSCMETWVSSPRHPEKKSASQQLGSGRTSTLLSPGFAPWYYQGKEGWYSSRVPIRLNVHSILRASCGEMHNWMDSVSSLLHACKGGWQVQSFTVWGRGKMLSGDK